MDSLSRRSVLVGSAIAATLPWLPNAAAAFTNPNPTRNGETIMSNGFVTTKDGTQIFYKDWGSKDAQPIVRIPTIARMYSDLMPRSVPI